MREASGRSYTFVLDKDNYERPPMTPAPPSGSRSGASGNPASGTPSLTVKQQRQVQREKKLEEFRRQEKRSKRNRKIGIISGVVGAVAIDRKSVV